MSHVIVDNEQVSKKLIQKGQLQYRTTFVPMNKIIGKALDASVIRNAEKLVKVIQIFFVLVISIIIVKCFIWIQVGKGKVLRALDLIDYEPEYRDVMEWAFGDVLICVDNDAANKVAFHPTVKRKCVTLDGDSYDPSGLVSGGIQFFL